MIVLDTNVLSELMRPAPEVRVSDWVAAQPAASVFTTTVTQAEVLCGVAVLPEGRRKAALEAAVLGLFREDFARCGIEVLTPGARSPGLEGTPTVFARLLRARGLPAQAPPTEVRRWCKGHSAGRLRGPFGCPQGPDPPAG